MGQHITLQPSQSHRLQRSAFCRGREACERRLQERPRERERSARLTSRYSSDHAAARPTVAFSLTAAESSRSHIAHHAQRSPQPPAWARCSPHLTCLTAPGLPDTQDTPRCHPLTVASFRPSSAAAQTSFKTILPRLSPVACPARQPIISGRGRPNRHLSARRPMLHLILSLGAPSLGGNVQFPNLNGPTPLLAGTTTPASRDPSRSAALPR